MNSKKEELQERTTNFALRVVRLFRSLPNCAEARVVGHQLLRSGTSVAANYRAACKGRSRADFISKLGIVEEEADETLFWLEFLVKSEIVRPKRMCDLIDEARQLSAIFGASRRTALETNRKLEIGNQRQRIVMTEARATLIDNYRFNAVATSGHAIVVDGDKKSGNSPMELVLIGLCGCTGYDVASILRKKREPFSSLEVRAVAERAATPPTVYTDIRLIYRIGGNVSHKAVEDAVRLSEEKYCSVSAMLQKTAKITFEIEYVTD